MDVKLAEMSRLSLTLITREYEITDIIRIFRYKRKRDMKFLKLTGLVALFLLLTPVKWISTLVINVFTFIEAKIADYTLYFLDNLK